MLFGTRESFAIEAMSEPELQAPSSVWGRMRVWCDGESIGDYAEPFCGLYPAYCGFKDLARTLPHLWSHELDGLSDIELWNHFDGLLYGYHGDVELQDAPAPSLLVRMLYGYHGDVELQDDRTFEQCHSDMEKWGKYNFLTNWGEQFDKGGKSFILCKPNRVVWILNRSLPPRRGISTSAPLKETLAAIQQYIKWFENEAIRLGGSA